MCCVCGGDGRGGGRGGMGGEDGTGWSGVGVEGEGALAGGESLFCNG